MNGIFYASLSIPQSKSILVFYRNLISFSLGDYYTFLINFVPWQLLSFLCDRWSRHTVNRTVVRANEVLISVHLMQIWSESRRSAENKLFFVLCSLFFVLLCPYGARNKWHSLGSCDRASWAKCEDRERERETNKMQQLDVYYQLLSQHVSGIIMPIFRRTNCYYEHNVAVCSCWTACSTSSGRLHYAQEWK